MLRLKKVKKLKNDYVRKFFPKTLIYYDLSVKKQVLVDFKPFKFYKHTNK